MTVYGGVDRELDHRSLLGNVVGDMYAVILPSWGHNSDFVHEKQRQHKTNRNENNSLITEP